MKKHVKIYIDFFGYSPEDRMPCEMGCGKTATEVHHIECKGMGGSKQKDFIENLMGLCRECHTIFGDKKQYKKDLYIRHEQVMKSHKSNYRFNWLLVKKIAGNIF